MPLSCWGEALTSAAYLVNWVPSRTIDFRTPSQVLAEAVVAPVPNLSPHVFGCVASVYLHKHQRNKLTPRALRCVVLGYTVVLGQSFPRACLHASARIFHHDLKPENLLVSKDVIKIADFGLAR